MPSTNGVKSRTKTDQTVDGAVAMHLATAEMDRQLGKMSLALQQVTQGMSASTFQRYRDALDALERE